MPREPPPAAAYCRVLVGKAGAMSAPAATMFSCAYAVIAAIDSRR